MESTNKPFVSIVIPFFNGAKFLNRCLESATHQFHEKKYQIILVNDGSTDDSLKIIESWIKKDSNIEVVTTSHQGVSHARNVGINLSKGEYIWFMDVDDLMLYYSLESIYHFAHEKNLDIISFGVRKLPDKDINNFIKKGLSDNSISGQISDCITGYDYIKKTRGLIWEYACVWQYLFKKDLILDAGIYFNEHLIYSEDLLFMWSILPRVKRMASIPEQVYIYVQNPNSCLNSKDTELSLRKTANLRTLAEYMKDNHNTIIPDPDPEIEQIYGCLLEDLIYRYMISLQQNVTKIKFATSAIKELRNKNLYPIGKYQHISPYMPKGFKWILYLKIINSKVLYIPAMVLTNLMSKILSTSKRIISSFII